MYHVVFEKLGLAFDVSRVAFTVGNLPIYWYGICIATGMLLALVFAFAKAKSFGINADRMVDVIMLSTVCAIVCARLYYVAFAPYEYANLWEIINLRDGGIAIYGAVIGAFVSGIFFCKWRNVRVLPMFDLASMGFLVGIGIGRWGNFFNQEAFGTNTDLPWGMFSNGTQAYLKTAVVTAGSGVTIDPNLPVHPTFLYEFLWCALGFCLLWVYSKRRKFDGEIALLALVWYAAIRFFVEGVRTDSLLAIPSLNLRVSQLLSAAAVFIGLAVWLLLRKKYRGMPLTVVYPLTAKELANPNGAVVSVGAITWQLGEKVPTYEEIKEKIEVINLHSVELAAEAAAAHEAKMAQPATEAETAQPASLAQPAQPAEHCPAAQEAAPAAQAEIAQEEETNG